MYTFRVHLSNFYSLSSDLIPIMSLEKGQRHNHHHQLFFLRAHRIVYKLLQTMSIFSRPPSVCIEYIPFFPPQFRYSWLFCVPFDYKIYRSHFLDLLLFFSLSSVIIFSYFIHHIHVSFFLLKFIILMLINIIARPSFYSLYFVLPFLSFFPCYSSLFALSLSQFLSSCFFSFSFSFLLSWLHYHHLMLSLPPPTYYFSHSLLHCTRPMPLPMSVSSSSNVHVAFLSGFSAHFVLPQCS